MSTTDFQLTGMLPASPNMAKPGSDGILEKPTLQLPELKFSDGASVENQYNRIMAKDSLPMQQARVTAREQGTASHDLHSSQQEGAAMRAMQGVAMPLAEKEATLQANQDLSNWTSLSQQNLEVYEKEYTERLTMKGYAEERAITMAKANTDLTRTLMSNITDLLGNPNIDFGEEVKNKVVDLFNIGQDNNNLILNMGFRY